MTWIEKITNMRYLAIYLFAFAFLLYLFNSWGVSIYILDEAKNASCAREMLESGNWLVPTFNYDLRTDKPPLHYFFMMLSYSVFGVNAFAARFFSAVFGALTILLTFTYTRRYSDIQTALWTAIILLASIHLSVQFHLAVPDPYLIFFITWSLFAFYGVVSANSKYDWFWMYLSISLAALTKGPVAILLPGLIYLLYLIFSKQLKWMVVKKAKPFIGVIIVLAIALPWYIFNGLETNWEWSKGFFFEHNLNRFSGEMEGHGGTFLLTFLYVFIGLVPFVFILPQALIYAFRNRKNSFLLYVLIAGLSIVGFFSVSQTKLPNYTVPSYPFLAFIISYFITNKLDSFRQIRVAFFVLFGIGIMLPIAVFVAAKYDPSLMPVRWLSVLLYVFPLLLIIAFLNRNNIQRFLFYIGLSGVITFIVFIGILFPRIDQQNPVSKSVNILNGKEVKYYQKFNPSYAFYLQRKIERIDTDDFETFFKENPDGRIISTTRWIDEIQLNPDNKVIFSGKDLFESPTTVLIAKEKK